MLLEVKDLTTYFFIGAGVVRAVDGGSYDVREGGGGEVGLAFREPMTSLTPVLSIGRQVTEPVEIHLGMTPAQARARAVELLGLVGIPDPARRLAQDPHPFSGGGGAPGGA